MINTKILRFMAIPVTPESSICLYCESTEINKDRFYITNKTFTSYHSG